MLLRIAHTTRYSYDEPVPYGLQQLRLRPASSMSQTVKSWSLGIEGGRFQARFSDQHGNEVDLIGIEPGATEIVLTCTGEIETRNTAGVTGPHEGAAALWYFRRQTDRTRPGTALNRLLKSFDPDTDDALARLHALSAHVLNAVPYTTEATHAETTAEAAAEDGEGVCQDHTHIFLSLARELGIPARYVSGYLMMNDREMQDASHAWAEAHVDGLGWVGFDISNAISPDERYVKIATGLDYAEAAPVSGFIHGGGTESLIVSLQVQQ